MMVLSLLQQSAIVPVLGTLANKPSTAGTLTEHVPVLLEDTEVGGIKLLVVSIGIVGAHILGLKHGNSEVKSSAASSENLALARTKAGHLIGATLVLLSRGQGGEESESKGLVEHIDL